MRLLGIQLGRRKGIEAPEPARLAQPPRSAATPVKASVPSVVSSAPPNLARILRPQATGRWLMPQLGSITPQYIEMTLRAAMAGAHQPQWELFDLMLDTWPELAACAAELSDGVMAMEKVFAPWQEEEDEPTDSSNERQRLVSAALRGMKPDVAADENDFDGCLRDLIDGWLRGVTVQEILWQSRPAGKLGTILAPQATAWVHPACYGFQDGVLGLRTGQGDGVTRWQGERNRLTPSPLHPFTPSLFQSFPEHKFLLGVHKAKSGSVPAGALLRPLAWWWCAANFSADWLLRLAELFGLPFRWASYDPNAPQAVIDSICTMLQNMGANGYAAFPTGTQLELKEPAKAGSDHSPQGELLDRADRYARMVLLGQTLTGASDASKGGGKAGMSTETGVKEQRIASCAAYVAGVVNSQFIPSILALNYGDDGECPALSFETKKEDDLVQKATIVQTLCTAGAGSIIGKDWLGKTFGIPKPAKDEETLAGPEPAATSNVQRPTPNAQRGEIDPMLAKDIRSALRIEDNETFTLALQAIVAGDEPGHQFHGNQFTDAQKAEAEVQKRIAEKKAAYDARHAKPNKWKDKALREDQKKAADIAPGTHGRMADSAIAKAENALASGQPHTLDVRAELHSDSAMTRQRAAQMEGTQIAPKTHAGATLDHAEKEIQNHGKIGKDLHPEAWPAVEKIRAAKERLGLYD